MSRLINKITRPLQKRNNQLILIVLVTIVTLIVTGILNGNRPYYSSKTVARIEEPFDNQELNDKRVYFKLVLNPKSTEFPSNAILTSIVVKSVHNGESDVIYSFDDLSVTSYSVREFVYDLSSSGKYIFNLYATFRYINNYGDVVTRTYLDSTSVFFNGDFV